jgi:hypothetical protein
LQWLTNNPTKRPQYVILFPDIPSRVNEFNGIDEHGWRYYSETNVHPSVSVQLRGILAGWQPFVTHLNMGDTNACKAYINKLRDIGGTYSPGKLIISAASGSYGNTNYYFDDAQRIYQTSTPGASASNAVRQAGTPPSAVTYVADNQHITGGSNVAGYFTWGKNGDQGAFYYTNVHFSGNSGWYVIHTIESFNGQRYQTDQGEFLQWFSAIAFGGSGYVNTPVGAVTHTDEPSGAWNNAAQYFGLWAAGKSFAICAWASRETPYFQAVGDPLVKK